VQYIEDPEPLIYGEKPEKAIDKKLERIKKFNEIKQ